MEAGLGSYTNIECLLLVKHILGTVDAEAKTMSSESLPSDLRRSQWPWERVSGH